MMPDVYMIAMKDWLPLTAFAVFLLSGIILLLFAHRQIGRRSRMLTARFKGLQGERDATPTPLTSLPEMTTLYTAETLERNWREKITSRLGLLLLASGVGGALLIAGFAGFPLITGSVLLGGILFTAAVISFRIYRRRARQRRFVEQLPEAIDIIIRGARVGMSLQENFQVIAGEMPDPVGGAFRTLAEKLAIGIDLETALDATVRSIGVKELQFMATTLILQRRTGGQYAEVLENLAQVLRDRRAQALKARALTSETRMSARIVTGVTGVILLIMSITNRAQLEFLFVDPLGQNLLIYSAISILFGFFIISRLLGTLK